MREDEGSSSRRWAMTIRSSTEMALQDWTDGLALDLISNARERINEDEQDPPESWIGFQVESGAGSAEGRVNGCGIAALGRVSLFRKASKANVPVVNLSNSFNLDPGQHGSRWRCSGHLRRRTGGSSR